MRARPWLWGAPGGAVDRFCVKGGDNSDRQYFFWFDNASENLCVKIGRARPAPLRRLRATLTMPP